MSPSLMPTEELGKAIEDAYPELAPVAAATGAPVYLVGGAVRDLLLGRGRADIDLVVVGDAAELAGRLGAAESTEHERFGTAKVVLDGHRVDIAAARSESYPEPGALPVVEPAADIEADLSRRDFTINAMAAALGDGPDLIDPHGGREDLESGLIRLLHRGSLRDDPTRALRAARYAARLGFEPEAETAALIRGADLDTVSADRRRAELNRIAAEPEAVRALELLADWGLVEPRPGGLELAARVSELLSTSPWEEFAPVGDAVLAAALGPTGAAEELAALNPARPSEAVEASAGRGPVELALARAMGAEWLDRYLLEWRAVALEIDGEDLITAGVSEGPAVGRGLRAALRLKLDDRLNGRDEELDAALEAARGSDGVA
jgi:tRNA nucleotidyltransferase (CCA-adding enzyme)